MNRLLHALICLLLLASPAFAAVSGEVLINGQDSTASGVIAQPVRTKDAGTLASDSQTKGLLSVGPLVYNGTNWDRLRGDSTNGAYVQVRSFTGGITPSDAFANPTTAINNFSLIAGFNGTTWDRIRAEGTNADGDAVLTLGALSTESYNKVFNGTTWDRQYSGIITGSALNDDSSNAVNIISTDTTTVVKATGGKLNAVFINTAGTAPASITFYNIASAGCTGTPASGNTMTIQTSTLNQIVTINHTFTLGICAVTAAGASKANISVLYR